MYGAKWRVSIATPNRASELTYIPGQIGKVLELTEIEARLKIPEAKNGR